MNAARSISNHFVAGRSIIAVIVALLLAQSALATDRYVRSTDGNDADDGLSWANAEATLAGAFAAPAVAGDTIYISDNHAESTAGAVILTSPGTAASPCRIICVDDAAEPPTALATTGSIATTGANNITLRGYGYWYGLTFSAGDAANNASIVMLDNASAWVKLDSCRLKLNSTNINPVIYIGVGTLACRTEWTNTVVEFGHANQSVTCRGPLIWSNTSDAVAGTSPTVLLRGWSSPVSSTTKLVGLGLQDTGYLIDQSSASNMSFFIEDCRLGSTSNTLNSIVGQGGVSTTIINSASTDINYRYYKETYQGTINQEATIVRTGGATDGGTPISRKMVTSANSKIYSPLVSDPIIVWADNLASTTVTVETVTDNVTLTDAMAWIDVEYLGTSGFPLSVTATDRMTDPIFGTPANQTTSTAAWTTTGLVTPVKQQLSVTFTPAEKGPYRVYVNLANNPSTPTTPVTMYFCPEVRGGVRQFMTSGGYVNEEGQISITRGGPVR